MKRLKTTVDVLLTVLVAVAAGLVIWRQLVQPSSGSRPHVESAKGVITADLAKNARGTGPIALVEFADYQCPFCGQHARDVDPSIRSEYVDKGILREVFVNFPLPIHAQAQKASEAAECAAAQGHFWEMHDSIFRHQDALGTSELTERAREIGLDVERFSQCLVDGESASVVARHKRWGEELAVAGTPAFFLGLVRADGSIDLRLRLNGALPLSDFQAQINKLAPVSRRQVGE